MESTSGTHVSWTTRLLGRRNEFEVRFLRQVVQGLATNCCFRASHCIVLSAQIEGMNHRLLGIQYYKLVVNCYQCHWLILSLVTPSCSGTPRNPACLCNTILTKTRLKGGVSRILREEAMYSNPCIEPSHLSTFNILMYFGDPDRFVQ